MSWSRPQDVVEKALAASTADGQVAFVVESSEANLRWASNSLTTNGAMRRPPLAMVAATVAICSGDTRTSRWPMALWAVAGTSCSSGITLVAAGSW